MDVANVWLPLMGTTLLGVALAAWYADHKITWRPLALKGAGLTPMCNSHGATCSE